MSGTARIATLTIGLTLVGALSVSAQPRRGAVVVGPRIHVYSPFFYDPFWGPWYPYAYAYPYYGRSEANIKTEVTPKDAEVFVDGYYAGHADDFDGVFKRLHVAPGGHAITLHLEGFRTVTKDVYVRPDSTFKMKTTMERLAAGVSSAPVPSPNRQPAPGRRSPRS